jgi:CRISPR-associated protein Cmr1
MGVGEPLEVTFELVTPAYAGAAERSETDGLRPPTLKALLRFWWRAMRPELSPDQLFKRESEIFGSTDKGQGLRIVPGGRWPDLRAGRDYDRAGTPEPDPTHGYMAYGAVAWESSRRQSELQVPRLHPPGAQSFRLILGKFTTGRDGKPRALSPMELAVHRLEVEGAVWLLSAFGGIGSRSRRGVGSIMVRDFPFLVFPNLASVEQGANLANTLRRGLRLASSLPQAARAVLARSHGEQDAEEAENTAVECLKDTQGTRFSCEPEHAALSNGSRVLVGSPRQGGFFSSPRDALRAAKEDFYAYRRSLGCYSVRQRQRATAPEGPDHRWRASMQGAHTPPAGPNLAPLAAAFGLPLPGHMASSGFDVDVVAQGKDIDRRASPVFFKVLRWGGVGFAPVILYMPSRFLPANARMVVQVVEPRVGGDDRRTRDSRIRWQGGLQQRGYTGVTDFLHGLLQSPTSVRWRCPETTWQEVAW